MNTKDFGSMGGNARTLALTAKERSEAAKRAAEMRWGKKKTLFDMSKFPLNAICGSDKTTLKFGEIAISAYVLENGQRVLSGRGMQEALGFDKNLSGTALSKFISTSKIAPFIDSEVRAKFDQKIEFKRPGSGGSAPNTYGYEATLLIDFCDAILRAKNDGVLSESQLRIAQQAEIIVRSVAKVGIIALVDEVTGYQKQKDEYQKILASYIEKELRPWLETFEENYYRQIYRLLGWNWDAFRGSGKNHPSYVGRLTNRIIYEKLPPGVMEALESVNPKNERGYRETRHHQHLTENVGYRHLIKHITAVTTIMEMYPDGAFKEALHKIDQRFPTIRLNEQLKLF